MEQSAKDPTGGRLRLRDLGPVREIRLARPEVHNALDEELIAGLTRAFQDVAREVEQAEARSSARPEAGTGAGARAAGTPADHRPSAPADPPDRPAPRAVLLTAEGKSFCAGADLNYMQRVAAFTPEENRADARRLAGLFHSVHRCPVFVLGRVQGTALGGGCGLVACCDLAIAAAGSRFGFTEVRLGIAPATISPFVVARIGAARARALFPTGEVFDAVEAQRIGLVDRVTSPEQLDAEVDRVLAALLGAAPGASRAAKALADGASASTQDENADLIARLRALPEGREGIAAFLGKRPPAWTIPWPPAAGPGDPA